MAIEGLEFDEEKHEYTVAGRKFAALTRVLQATGFFDYSNLPFYYAARGNSVHIGCNLYDQGILDADSLSPDVEPYVVAYAKFLNESGYTVQETEGRRYHSLLRVAGTFDRKGHFPRTPQRKAYLDLKTGAPVSWHGIQLAGYVLLDTGWLRLPPLVDRYGLYLRNDESYRLVEYKDAEDAEIFVAAAKVYNYHTRHGKENEYE